MKKGHQMSMSRKIEIVRTVLSKAKGLNMLHGDKLVHHIANSIVLYEQYRPSEKDEKK